MQSCFSAGTAFWVNISEPWNRDRHLYTIISDPTNFPDNVVYVNFTSLDTTAPLTDVENDRACVVTAGEHPFIEHLSCVCYGGAHECSLYHLQCRYDKGSIRLHTDPVDSPLLEKIRVGARDSIHFPFAYRQIMMDQGLI